MLRIVMQPSKGPVYTFERPPSGFMSFGSIAWKAYIGKKHKMKKIGCKVTFTNYPGRVNAQPRKPAAAARGCAKQPKVCAHNFGEGVKHKEKPGFMCMGCSKT